MHLSGQDRGGTTEIIRIGRPFVGNLTDIDSRLTIFYGDVGSSSEVPVLHSFYSTQIFE